MVEWYMSRLAFVWAWSIMLLFSLDGSWSRDAEAICGDIRATHNNSVVPSAEELSFCEVPSLYVWSIYFFASFEKHTCDYTNRRGTEEVDVGVFLQNHAQI